MAQRVESVESLVQDSVPAAASESTLFARARTALLAHRWSVLAFASVIVLAAVLRLLTYEQYLPVMAHSDEPVYYLIVQNWRDLQNNGFVRYRYAGYPPAYPIINWGVQLLVEATSRKGWYYPIDYWPALRQASAVAGVLTVLLIGWAAWQLGGSFAGILAALMWATVPVILEHNNYALPDPFVYLGSAAAIAMAIRAWRKESPGWLFGSLAAAIFVVYLKYSPIGALVPWGIVALWMFFKNPKKMLPWMIAQGLFALIAAYWLIGVYGALKAPTREVEQLTGSENIAFMTSPARNLNNWYWAIYPIGQELFWGGMALSAACYVISRVRRWKTVPAVWAAIIFVACFVGIVMTASYTNIWLQKIRHALPTTVALIVLWAAAIGQIAYTLRDWLATRVDARRTTYSFVTVASAFTLLVGVPNLAGDFDLMKLYSRTDIHYPIWTWADQNLPVEGYMSAYPTGDQHYTFNREWSGYNGKKEFLWWNIEKLAEPQQLKEWGIAYLFVTDDDLKNAFNKPEDRALLNKLTFVKFFPGGPTVRGPSTYVYRVLPPQYKADSTYGAQISLVGYDFAAKTLQPGDTLKFRPYWRIRARPADNYNLFIHLYPADDTKILAQDDGPLTTVIRPTLLWDDPNELYIGRDITLKLPPDLAPGRYRMALGLYNYTTGQRLKVEDGGDFTFIEIEVGK